MDRKRRRYWGRYLRDLADRMELRDWTVTTMHRPAEERHAASCTCIYGRKVIEVHFGIGFDKSSPDDQRQTLVHELLHAHMALAQRPLIDARDNISKTWVSMLESNVMTGIEYAIDAIADGWAKHLPLPPVDEKPKRKRGKA